MSQSPTQPPAGWYPDPAGGAGERFWDGQAWSQATRDKSQRTQWTPPADAPGQGGQPTGPQWSSGPQQQYPPQQGSGPYPPVQQPYGQVWGKPVPAQGGYALAGFWWRVLGYIVDGFIVGVLDFVLTAPVRAQASTSLEYYLGRLVQVMQDPSAEMPPIPQDLISAYAMLIVISLVLLALYRTLTLGLMNATLGQRLCGLRVATRDDEQLAPIGWKAAASRGIFGALIYQVIGFFGQISVLFTDRKQTLPDMISKTVVVNTREAVQPRE